MFCFKLFPLLPSLCFGQQLTDFHDRFHDHQIITSHKDSIGTEYLSLPFRKEELESILEELMS